MQQYNIHDVMASGLAEALRNALHGKNSNKETTNHCGGVKYRIEENKITEEKRPEEEQKTSEFPKKD